MAGEEKKVCVQYMGRKRAAGAGYINKPAQIRRSKACVEGKQFVIEKCSLAKNNNLQIIKEKKVSINVGKTTKVSKQT